WILKLPGRRNTLKGRVMVSGDETPPVVVDFSSWPYVNNFDLRHVPPLITIPCQLHDGPRICVGGWSRVPKYGEHEGSAKLSFQHRPFVSDELIISIAFRGNGIEKRRWRVRATAVGANFVCISLLAMLKTCSDADVSMKERDLR